MIPLLTADQMRALEQESIADWGIPSLLLQEHAAQGALALLPSGEPIHVLAGPGNNGGDALALARLARLQGRQVDVWTLRLDPVWQGDAALQAKLWEGLGGSYRFTENPNEIVATFHGWVVDGLFGLGSRPLEGLAERWGLALNSASASGQDWSHCTFKVMALDLPSGLDPNSGTLATTSAIAATCTACFSHRKVCHGLLPARALCGSIHVLPIPLRGQAQSKLWLSEAPSQWYSGYDTHKREMGHLGIRAGRKGMSGAVVLAALGALRMGAGLVTVLVDEDIRAEVAAQVPEAMVRPWNGVLPDDIDALLVGPGGMDEIPEWDGPLVLDASALGEGQGVRWMQRKNTVLTPHPGEFARLFQRAKPEGSSERLKALREVAVNQPGVLVLKGAQTLIAGAGQEDLIVNPSGHRGLSTGGTGDFLAGMVGASVARWKQEWSHAMEAQTLLLNHVRDAVWLHGAAADRVGPGPLMVRELGSALASILRELHKDWDGDWRALSER